MAISDWNKFLSTLLRENSFAFFRLRSKTPPLSFVVRLGGDLMIFKPAYIAYKARIKYNLIELLENQLNY